MKQYISEERAIYEDSYHGLFSKNLAEWAIKHMELKDPTTGQMRAIKPRTPEEVYQIMKNLNVQLPEKYLYTAWYLWHMAVADYPKALTTDLQRACFVEETICDPDGKPENVLDCFVTKMCNAGIPIFWERML